MGDEATVDQIPPRGPSKWSLKRGALYISVLIVVYVVTAYVIVPGIWLRYAHRHPAFEDIPRITYTGDGHPGDPLNVALVGTGTQLKKIMIAAKWYPADPLTLRSCLEIAEASVLKRPYDAAPVSNLFLFGRKEDLAFEKPIGNDPRERHHVRFWLTENQYESRQVWVGSAVFDKKVGLSRTTGQVTHVTAPEVDKERDYLFHDLEETGDLAKVEIIDGFHQVLKGTNGGGDPWYTDGKLYAGLITPKMPDEKK